MKLLKRIGIVLLALTVVCCAAAGIYAADYYRMDETAAAAMESNSTVTVTTDNDLAIFAPAEPHTGLIFYPGGKVEYTAYAPLMHTLADSGVLCIIPKMPLNLAVMDMHAAADIPDRYPEIDTWYIGGHSLGGSMAASHAASCDDFKGLILLASYSTADLSDTGLRVLSIYGSNDKVLDMKKYAQYREIFPADSTEIVFVGGNHAQFGSYGNQEGDGSSTLPSGLQSDHTAVEILKWIGKEENIVHYTEDIHYIHSHMGTEGKYFSAALTLYPEEQRYILSEPVFSSYFNTGTYTVTDDILTAVSDDGQRTYHFHQEEHSLFYIAEGSNEILAHDMANTKPVSDGAEFASIVIHS